MSEIVFRLAGRFGDFRLEAEAALPGSGVTALVGPSGAGKTTLLRCLAGLARAQGEVRVGAAVWQDGRAFTPTHRRGVGYVFQEPSLLAHLSVKANLAYAAKRASERAGPEFDEVAAMLGLGGLLHRSPDALSGGERQRVAIARAMVGQRQLLLADEPSGALDSGNAEGVMRLLHEACKNGGMAAVVVTHDAQLASWADRVVFLRDGRVTDQTALEPGPESLLTPGRPQ
jgi:molybdate transport system ATP-binding protein